MLYERGYTKDDILELFRFIDWVLTLPEELEEDFARAVEEYEEAVKMPYITSVERVGIKRGREQGRQEGSLDSIREAVLDVLETRFGEAPGTITSALAAMQDPLALKRLHKAAVIIGSLEAFLRLVETRC